MWFFLGAESAGRIKALIYNFECYCLDAERRELRVSDKLVAIEPQVFDVLQYLICNRDHVVSRNDLIAGVWKGRIVSESTLSGAINAVRHSVGDSGEEQRLIRTVARKGFRFVGEIREENGSRGAAPANSTMPANEKEADSHKQPGLQAPPLPEKASIAVLPFLNISGDPEQEYFADGITEDIITALSQFRWFFVIARGSSFTYKGKSVDAKQIGRELGIRYLLEGSVRKSGNRVRITCNLIDIATGANLWVDRFDGVLEDIFDLQDRISTSVVGAIAPKIEEAEIQRAKRKPTENLDAYDYFLRGMPNVHLWTRNANNEALRTFHKAVELDPEFASAHGMLARCYSQRKFSGWMADRERETAEAEKAARRAAELGRDVPLALATAGLGLAYVAGDVEHGAALIDRAIELNPNLAWAWHFSGWVKVLVGEPETAIDRMSRAMRLSPQDPQIFNMRGVTASAHFFAGRYGEASTWAEKAIRDQPNYSFGNLIYPASKALAGHVVDAKQAMRRFRQLDPLLRIADLNFLYPLHRPGDLAKWSDGLRQAGLPD